jgi:glycosyltransferase involved in cell wall biosynthesis
LVFDALYPVTKGGAERWFTALASELVADGHQVTYVTVGRGVTPSNLPFEVCEVVRGGRLYEADGRRRLMGSVLFGLASGWWLLRHRRQFDGAYVHQTPLFSVIAARVVLGRSVPWAVEWIEWWNRDYWRRYAPGIVGRAGWLVQLAALRATPQATAFARSTERRLRQARPRLPIALMPGQVFPYAQAKDAVSSDLPLVLFVGRLVPEKHADAAIAAIALLAQTRAVRGRIIGQGPLLEATREQAAACPADVEVLGPVEQHVLDTSYREASVLLHPSEREGFGLVVIEAAAHAVPVVVVDGPDNAAVELVLPGRNGYISPSRGAEDLAREIHRAIEGGNELRESCRAWYVTTSETRSVRQTAQSLVELLRGGPQAGRARK